jgi:hypothetical protein
MGFKLKSGNTTGFKNMGSSPAKQVNLSKMSGLGPSTAFGGVKNPELTKTKKPFSKKVMKDGPKNKIHGIDNAGDWQPHQFRDKKSPAKQKLNKQGEAQDQDKIFNNKGEHVGDWVDGKKVMKSTNGMTKNFSDLTPAEIKALKLDKPIGSKKKELAMNKKSPAKQTDSTYTDGSKKSKREQDFSKRHTAEKATYNTSEEDHAKQDPYWYKVNGKKVSKHVYINYKNKPGGDEPGKQTNNPDAYGYKAKRKKDREDNQKKPKK